MNLSDIPLDDPKTFKLLSDGHTCGVFQFESSLMTGILRQVKPQSIREIGDVSALGRPGSVGNGYHTQYARNKQTGAGPNIHPDINDVIAPVLADTYGTLVYQEQVMQILSVLAGWSYAEAEGALKAMGKKKPERLAQLKPALFRDAEGRGHSREAMEALWEVLLPFSDYAFNLSHSVGYAHISYYTAYLKANHPIEYMTALLSSAEDTKELRKYIDECRRMDISILPPDVNESDLGFTPTTRGIRYGIAAIKGIGEGATQSLIDKRPYDSIDDFFRRASAKVLNARVLEALIKSGCLDSLWPDREVLLGEATEIARLALDHRKHRSWGQRTLFRADYRPRGSSGENTEPEAGTTKEDGRHRVAQRRQWESELLGVEVSTTTVVLKPTRMLDATEWLWVRQTLMNYPASSRVELHLKDTVSRLPVLTSADPKLVEQMKIVGIEVEER